MFCRKWLAAASLAAATVSAEAFAGSSVPALRLKGSSVQALRLKAAPAVMRRHSAKPLLRVRGGNGLQMSTTGGRFPDSTDTTTRLTPANAGKNQHCSVPLCMLRAVYATSVALL